MILLLGATGQVGTALAPLAAAVGPVVAPDRQALDLDDPGSLVAALDEMAPSIILNAAAWTAVDAAEEHEAAATRINGDSVAVMADWAAANDAWLLTFSSDYVFDGRGDRPVTESHPTSPINAYGRGKLVGEQAAVASSAALVVRTSWVVSPEHPNFVRTMLSLLERGTDPRVIDDQHGCPTITTDLAGAVISLLAARPTGLLHLTNTGATTWHGLARDAARLAGFDPQRVAACTTQDYPTPAVRPAWSVLGSERLKALGVVPLPDWHESLPAVVAAQMAFLGGAT